VVTYVPGDCVRGASGDDLIESGLADRVSAGGGTDGGGVGGGQAGACGREEGGDGETHFCRV